MQRKSTLGLKSLSIFEAAKGALVLLVGAGLLTLIHKDVQHEAAEIVRFFHLNPARHYPEIFIKTLSNIGSLHLWFLSVSAILYAIIRLAEAYGLWRDQSWAVWFAIASDVLFLPMELFELTEYITLSRIFILLANLALVIYLLGHMRRSSLHKH